MSPTHFELLLPGEIDSHDRDGTASTCGVLRLSSSGFGSSECIIDGNVEGLMLHRVRGCAMLRFARCLTGVD